MKTQTKKVEMTFNQKNCGVGYSDKLQGFLFIKGNMYLKGFTEVEIAMPEPQTFVKSRFARTLYEGDGSY